MAEEKEEIKYIEKFYRFTCKDCGMQKEFPDKGDAPRAIGWVSAKGNQYGYCPACGLKHCNTWRAGVKKGIGNQLTLGEVSVNAI